MRAVAIPEKGTVEIATLPDPAPGEREVAGCGICGTDLHILQGEFAPSLPLVPGHEFAGRVVAVGPGVEGLAEGDAVAVDPTLNCGECRQCRLGRFNLCERWRAIGVSDPGGAARFAVAPAANCVRLPEGVSTRDAALIEPLSQSYERAAGTAGARGVGVEAFAVGDRVLLEPNLVDGTCMYCASGRYNLCEHVAAVGCQTAGGLAEAFVAPAGRFHRVPEGCRAPPAPHHSPGRRQNDPVCRRTQRSASP